MQAPEYTRETLQALIERFQRAKPGALKAMLGNDASILVEIFVNRNLDGWPFDGEDLEDVDFSGASLVGATFRGARLRGARFDRAWVERHCLYEALDWTTHVLTWQRPAEPSVLVPHRVGERFAEAPFAPELVMLPKAELDAVEGLDDEEAEALAEGRVAIAILPVTVAQIALYELRAKERGGAWSDDCVDCPCPLGDISPMDYASWLSRAVGGDYRVPSSGLWQYAASAGEPTNYPWGNDFEPNRAVTAEAARHRDWPAPVDSRLRPGEGRCNKWGLFDAVGNLRQVAREIDPDTGAEKLCLCGGSFRLGGGFAILDRRWYPESLASYSDVGLRVVRLFARQPR
jgi:hypothetical protein